MISWLRMLWRMMNPQRPLSPNMQKRHNRAVRRLNKPRPKYFLSKFWFRSRYELGEHGMRTKLKAWETRKGFRMCSYDFWLKHFSHMERS